MDGNALVTQSHIIDDLATENARMRRCIDDQTRLLGDALHALRAGSLAVADEFVDRAITALTAVRK